MDWQLNLLFLWVLMPFVYTWSPISSTQRRSFYASTIQQQQQQHTLQQQPSQQRQFQQHQRNAISPYLDLALCPLRQQPWTCARERSARLLDIWDDELHVQWQKLKDEADRQLNSTLERRGYSDTTTLSKEKPSTILKKIEIGTNYMKKYLAETMDGFLGREYDYLDNNRNNYQNEEDNEADDYNEDEEVEDEEVEEEEQESDNQQTGGLKSTNEIEENANDFNHENNNDNEVEFVELAEDNDNNNNENTEDENEEDLDELKKPGGGNKRRKKNKKKKGSQHEIATQAANLLVIQPLEQQLATHQHDEAHGVTTQLLKPVKQKIKPFKQKRRKRKKGGGTSTIVVEQEPATDHLGLGLLEELADWDGDVGGKRKKKYPMKYGRSNGVTRGKKKKKKKALMKLMLLGSFLKAKIELLLKLLGAHLQIKFFAVAFIGLLINIARFWIDIKRGGEPQKVVYVEHAHHQHHYEDHGGEDWSESGGGYWKRSLQTDSTENTYDSVTDSYQPRQQLQQQQLQQQYDPQYMAYRNQWQRK